MQKSLEDQIKRAKELLKVCLHASMATVNDDGSPHNSPFVFMRDSELNYIFWGSHPDSLHSKNILRTGKIFVVLYEADERGGLYIEANNGHIAQGDELRITLEIHNQLRLSLGKNSLPLDYYSGDSPQRMWSAKINRLWVNASERDTAGNVIKDIRTEVSAKDLIS